MIGPIEKAIQKSDIGINPSNDGKVVRLLVPELNEERRKELVQAGSQAGRRWQGRRSRDSPRRDGSHQEDEEGFRDHRGRAEDRGNGASEGYRQPRQGARHASARTRKRRSWRFNAARIRFHIFHWAARGLPIIAIAEEAAECSRKSWESSCRICFGVKRNSITVPVAPGAATQQALPPDNLPRHVAIIMDGNGRWAVQRGLPRLRGPRGGHGGGARHHSRERRLGH